MTLIAIWFGSYLLAPSFGSPLSKDFLENLLLCCTTASLTFALIGVAVGIVVGLWMESLKPTRYYIPPLLPAAVGWLVAISALVAMIQRARLTAAQKIFLVICLPLPCYILFIPVCTINASYAENSAIRHPLASLWVIACGSAFPLVLLFVAASLRVFVRWAWGDSG